MNSEKIGELELHAAKSRRKVLRMLRSSRAGHLGGALSCIDIMSALFFHTMKYDAKNPKLPERDRFVLSAGHKCMALYAVLCEAGYFDESILDTYGKINTKIPGHPDMYKLPGVEANTGALGHGLSISVGMALGLRGGSQRVFTVMGDGELPEGSNWEAIAAAAHHKVENLTAIVDWNSLQISGRTADIMNMNPVGSRFAAFGWSVREIDGNDMSQIVDALDALPFEKGKPSAIIARTIKGKGLSFAEDQVNYHYWKPNDEDLLKAENEIDEVIKRRTDK